MFCPNCAKLANMPSTRKCVRCNGVIENKIACICKSCSNERAVCEVCLKKINVNSSGTNTLKLGVGCKACGK